MSWSGGDGAVAEISPGAESAPTFASAGADGQMQTMEDTIYEDLRHRLDEHYPTERAREKLAADGDMLGFFERWKHEWEQRDGYTEDAWEGALRRLREETELVEAITARS